MRLVAEALILDGVRSPTRAYAKSGNSFGGVTFSRGQIYSLLKCPTYVSEIHHKGQIYQGLHPPIIDRAIWDQVQAKLAENCKGTSRLSKPHASLLAGKLVDNVGDRLVAVHATKGNARYRYYVSHGLHHGTCQTGMRIPAVEIETAVRKRLGELFEDGIGLATTAGLVLHPGELANVIARCHDVASAIAGRNAQLIRDLVREVRVHRDHIEIICNTPAIESLLKVSHRAEAPDAITLIADVRLTRSGRAMRLIQNDGSAVTQGADRSVIKLILKARSYWQQLQSGTLNVTQLAA